MIRSSNMIINTKITKINKNHKNNITPGNGSQANQPRIDQGVCNSGALCVQVFYPQVSKEAHDQWICAFTE